MTEPEIAFDEFENAYFHDSIRESLRDQGGIVIRRAIPAERCDFYRSLITKTHDHLESQCAKHGYPVDAVSDEDQHKPGLPRLAYELREGQLPPGMFEQVNPGFSIFDLVGDIRFARIMARFFDGDFGISPSAHTRRISPDNAKHSQSWQKPALCHIDAQYHDPRHFSLNFWVPLDNCGRDAPGLQIIRDNVFDTQRYVAYDPEASTFDAESLRTINEDVYSQFERDRLYAPELNVGDIFLIHNWTIHQTNCHPDMSNVRQSCELRVIQGTWSFPKGRQA